MPLQRYSSVHVVWDFGSRCCTDAHFVCSWETRGLYPFRQQRVRIWGICIRSSLPEIDVFLVLKRFAGRTVRNAILLVLVEVEHPFQYRNQNAGPAGHPHHPRKTQRRQERDYCRSRNLNHLYSLKVSLIGQALSVIPTNLIFEPLHNGISIG
jgi:hypothetical protein